MTLSLGGDARQTIAPPHSFLGLIYSFFFLMIKNSSDFLVNDKITGVKVYFGV
jgi:hypothetical protein